MVITALCSPAGTSAGTRPVTVPSSATRTRVTNIVISSRPNTDLCHVSSLALRGPTHSAIRSSVLVFDAGSAIANSPKPLF